MFTAQIVGKIIINIVQLKNIKNPTIRRKLYKMLIFRVLIVEKLISLEVGYQDIKKNANMFLI